MANVTWVPAAIIQEVILAAFTAWLVRFFAMRNTSKIYLIAVYISW